MRVSNEGAGMHPPPPPPHTHRRGGVVGQNCLLEHKSNLFLPPSDAVAIGRFFSGFLPRGPSSPRRMVRQSQVEAVLFPFDQVPAPPQCGSAMRNLGRLEKLFSRRAAGSRQSSLAASRPPSVTLRRRLMKHSLLQHFVLMTMPSGANLRRNPGSR